MSPPLDGSAMDDVKKKPSNSGESAEGNGQFNTVPLEAMSQAQLIQYAEKLAGELKQMLNPLQHDAHAKAHKVHQIELARTALQRLGPDLAPTLEPTLADNR